VTRLAYFEWSAPDSAEHDDPEAWAQANPALGIRISPDAIETERTALEPDDFARERLGIYPEDLDATEAAIDVDDWKACAAPDSKIVGPPVLVFEVSVDRKTATIAAVGTSSAGGIHVEVVEHRNRTGWVVARLGELNTKHKPTALICNPAGPAGALLADCDRAGLTITEVKGNDYAKACAAAYDDITEHRWRHINQATLTAAATGAAKRDQGDGFVFDRRGLLDIAPLTAVSLGAWVLGKGPGPSVYEERGLLIL
jgi:hypothetical protein